MFTQALTMDEDHPALHLALVHTLGEDNNTDALEHATRSVELCRECLDDPEMTSEERPDVINVLRTSLCYCGLAYARTQEMKRASSCIQELVEDWGGLENVLEDGRALEISIMSTMLYLLILTEQKEYTAAARLLERFANSPSARSPTFNPAYELLMDSEDESFAKAFLEISHRADCFEVLDKIYSNAIHTCARHGIDGEVSALRFHRASAMIRLCPSRSEEILTELHHVLADVEIASPSNAYHGVKEMAQTELARFYLHRALDARGRDAWQEVGMNADELGRLCRLLPSDAKSPTVLRVGSCILAAWKRLNS
jgi:hypothetical protein